MVWIESPNHRPGKPHRSWHKRTITTPVDFLAVVGTSRSRAALERLRRNEPLSKDDLFALASANTWAFTMWYQPIVGFIQPDRVEFEPGVLDLIDGLDEQAGPAE